MAILLSTWSVAILLRTWSVATVHNTWSVAILLTTWSVATVHNTWSVAILLSTWSMAILLSTWSVAILLSTCSGTKEYRTTHMVMVKGEVHLSEQGIHSKSVRHMYITWSVAKNPKAEGLEITPFEDLNLEMLQLQGQAP